MKNKDHEEQLREFFKHHPVDNPLYLKKYVKEHPANKMAWYLLGREYTAQGKHGKALYCFTQAGEVYEAFEKQAAPVLPESFTEAPPSGKGRDYRYLARLRLAAVAAMAALVLLYVPVRTAAPPAQDTPDQVPDAQVGQTKIYYIAKEKTKENVGAALQEIFVKEKIGSYSVLVQGEPSEDKRWIWWLKTPKVLLSVEGKAEAASQSIVYHDAASCDCQPTEPVKPLSIFVPWAQQQEQELILRSALAAYYRKNGKLPDALQELSRPYPENILPGVTPYMEARYESGKELLAADAVKMAPPPGAADPQPASAPPSAFTKPLSEPLHIVVDKTAHRLALVSGNLIIRNYPIGAGGGKTPEGEFVISEKVRNPNGKSNGDFGSRGMTLSDTLYAIHGTNKPSSIGKDQSLGCIRMLQQDVEELFDMVPMGTKVTIGKGLLPAEIGRSGNPFQMPLFSEETNPGKVYKWLD